MVGWWGCWYIYNKDDKLDIWRLCDVVMIICFFFFVIEKIKINRLLFVLVILGIFLEGKKGVKGLEILVGLYYFFILGL